MSIAMTDEKGERIALAFQLEDRLGKAGRGGIRMVRINPLVQVEEDSAAKRSALIGQDEIDGGKAILLPAPDTGETAEVSDSRCRR